MVDREDAWDDLQIIAGPDGSFAVPALPAEVVTVGCRVKGYFFSPRNRSLNGPNQIFLEGLVDRDVADLVVLLEPGPTPPFPKSTPELWEATDKLKQTTLAGAPADLATPAEHR